MQVTFNFTDHQANLFIDSIENTLRAAMWQEMAVQDHLDKDEERTAEELENLWTYHRTVASQRVLLAEVLATLREHKDKTSIITNVSDADLAKLTKK